MGACATKPKVAKDGNLPPPEPTPENVAKGDESAPAAAATAAAVEEKAVVVEGAEAKAGDEFVTPAEDSKEPEKADNKESVVESSASKEPSAAVVAAAPSEIEAPAPAAAEVVKETVVAT